MYTPIHFSVHELVPKQVYLERGEKALQLLDYRLLKVIDFLRDEFGRVTINNYQWGGDREWSGLRTLDSPYYSKYSQHTFGRAFDMVFTEYSVEEVRVWLKENWKKVCEECDIEGFTVEETVSWLHIDLRNNKKGYNSFYP